MNKKLPNPDPTAPIEEEHDHAHDHDHDHAHGHHHHHDDPLHPHIGAPLNTDELDPASKSLNEALRVSFTALTFVMIGLLIAYVLSGTHNVEEGRMAVRLMFGSIRGEPGEQVLGPGGPYLWPPEPIGRFIEVDTTVQQVTLSGNFWPQIRRGTQLQDFSQRSGGPLTPGEDGSLITADKNIVHGQWTINYRIGGEAGVVDFIRNVSAEGDTREMQDRADAIVRFAAERAIVHAVAQVAAEDFIRSGVEGELIRELIQEELRDLETGLVVTQVNLVQATAPAAVSEAFRAVSEAESEKARKIANARREASTVLNEAAGAGYRELLAAIEAYEAARRAEDEAAVEATDAAITELLQVNAVQGEVSEMIRSAILYKRSIESDVRAEAEEFQRLLPEYRANPRIVLSRRWQDTLENILSGDVETFYLPSNDQKNVYLEVNRDPRIEKERIRQRNQAQMEAQQAAQQNRSQLGNERRPHPPAPRPPMIRRQ